MKKYYEALCDNYEFRRIYSKGKSFVSPLIVIYVMKNRQKKIRVGITTSKKTGNAIKRNRSRRIIREAFHQHVSSIKEGYDFVLVARSKTPFVKMTDIQKVLFKHFTNAGVWK